MMLEHRARLALIRIALDIPLPQDKVGSQLFRWLDSGKQLPDNYIAGVRHLQSLPYRSRVPHLLQVFLEVFGGFYVKGTSDLDAWSG